MIKTYLPKMTSILMALLVMVSTMSVTIEKHFCGDVLVDVSLFAEAEKCGMEAKGATPDVISKKSCCEDTVDIIQGQDELTIKTIEDLNLEQQQFLAVYVYAYVDLFEGLSQHIIPYQYYDPPHLVYDIQMLDEVYLI